MVCKNCGLESTDVTFCPNCGTRLEEPPVYQVPLDATFTAQQPVVIEEEAKNPAKGKGIAAMILGILGLVLPCLCCCCGIYGYLIGAFIGLVLCIVALVLGKSAKRASEEAGFSNGPAKAGSILGLIGVILAAIAFLLVVAYIVIVLVLGIGAGFASSFNDFSSSYDNFASSYNDYYYY